MTTLITDDQIRDACNKFDLDPVGRVEVRGYETDLDPDNADDWDGDACWELAHAIVSGTEYPEAGPLGFAAGHLSPGWKFLRDLCDRVAENDIDADWFAAFTYDEARDHLRESAEDRARLETWTYALVCVADLGIDETTEDASVWLGECSGEDGGQPLSKLAWTLLGHAGYLVLREVFAPQIDSKRKD